jgi:hypothetical protein
MCCGLPEVFSRPEFVGENYRKVQGKCVTSEILLERISVFQFFSTHIFNVHGKFLRISTTNTTSQ